MYVKKFAIFWVLGTSHNKHYAMASKNVEITCWQLFLHNTYIEDPKESILSITNFFLDSIYQSLSLISSTSK